MPNLLVELPRATQHTDLTPFHFDKAIRLALDLPDSEPLNLSFTRTGESGAERDGRYIRFEYQGEQNYIAFASKLDDSGIPKGRNTYLVQPFIPAYGAYLADTAAQKKIHIFFPEKIVRITARQYHALTCALIKTLGVNFLNTQDAFDWIIHSFNSVEELIIARSNTIRKGNSPSYLDLHTDIEKSTREVTKKAIVFSKVDGANATEAILLCAVVDQLANGKVLCYPMQPSIEDGRRKAKFTQPQMDMMQALGIEIKDDLAPLPPLNRVGNGVRKATSRNTVAFHMNLFRKYNKQECAMCDWDVPGTLIGAHIRAIYDIDADSTLSEIEKAIHSTSGENGLWLCRNHDKLFEDGFVYYNEEYQLQISDRLPEEHTSQILDMTTKHSIQSEHHTQEMWEYLNHHRRRISR